MIVKILIFFKESKLCGIIKLVKHKEEIPRFLLLFT
jgi:hypothetical protein